MSKFQWNFIEGGPKMVNRVGQQLGNYHILRLLGEGGFAEVYLGEHIHLGTHAAIKVLHTQLTSEDMDKFRAEARNLANLVHPHIVRVLDFGLEGKTPFLVMDFASNGTLRQLFPNGTRLATANIVTYVRQVASGLQYAHDKKLIHRDIKPENMLLGQNNEVLLSDFGIAVIAQSSHSQSMQEVIGTVSYMAPEQFQGKPRLASDQYALGIVVYEWLGGSRPFRGTFFEIASQHMFVPAPSLCEKDATISPAVEGVVLKALAKDPTQRFANVQEFADSLAKACQPSQSNKAVQPTFFPSSSQPTLSSSIETLPPTVAAMTSSVNTSQTTDYIPPVPIGFSSQPEINLQLQDTALYLSNNPSTEIKGIPQQRKNPNFALIIGTAFLLLVLVSGSIFFFSRGNFLLGGTTANPNLGNNTSHAGGSISGGNNGKGCKKIGVLLPETVSSARWDSKDKPLLKSDIGQLLSGAVVDYANAGGSATEQQNQAEADLTNGDCILVVAASDSQAAAAIVTKAKAQNVPVIAYDRLIQSKDLAYYVSFDNVKVGFLQGQYIADHYQSFVNGSSHNNVVMINGSQTDNNALLFRQGALSTLQPLYDNGKLKKVYDQFTPNWDNPTAQTEMEGALTANANNVQIAYVANDGMANSVIAALKAQRLNGKVLVTGQDATVTGIQNILTGDQAMTVYKPIAKEAMATAQLVAAISNGTDTSPLINGQVKTSDGTAIPSLLETPIAVDKTNIQSTVLADGFVTKSDICTGLPAGTNTSGICP